MIQQLQWSNLSDNYASIDYTVIKFITIGLVRKYKIYYMARQKELANLQSTDYVPVDQGVPVRDFLIGSAEKRTGNIAQKTDPLRGKHCAIVKKL